jgi:hypothetical protein
MFHTCLNVPLVIGERNYEALKSSLSFKNQWSTCGDNQFEQLMLLETN